MIEGMEVEESVELAVSPHEAYDTVRQLERMGEWSPENQGGAWQSGDGTSVGDVFVGHNKIGDFEWDAPAAVTACDPGELYSFSVPDDDDPVAKWFYRFEATADGCRLTERWEMHRPPPSMVDKPRKVLEKRRDGVRAGMRSTLDALAASLTTDG